jgi:xanthine dehydrogenase/oxidase
MQVYASTRNPTETQVLLARVLGVDSHKVMCRVKRLGGGFGGKETRSAFLSCALAVAVRKHGLPVRFMLKRKEDMCMTGTRHPFLGRYRVAFAPDGKLHALQLDVFSNGGYSLDLSLAVLERAMTHSDNSFYIPIMHIHGRVCKSNLPTNTAFRGFGGPQGMLVRAIVCFLARRQPIYSISMSLNDRLPSNGLPMWQLT